MQGATSCAHTPRVRPAGQRQRWADGEARAGLKGYRPRRSDAKTTNAKQLVLVLVLVLALVLVLVLVFLKFFYKIPCKQFFGHNSAPFVQI